MSTKDVTLSASVRNSLLSLQNTREFIQRTQGRLSTGLKVASAIDDPVAYFQSKGLSDRASDFTQKKDAINQGVSTVTGALNGVDGIEALVSQMKGVVQSMKSMSASQVTDLVAQFNDLRSQINNLAADATYQGTNLINGTGQTLTVEFSDKTASRLVVRSVDLTNASSGLNLQQAVAFTGGFVVKYSARSFTAGATNTTFTSGPSGWLGDGLSNTQSLTLTWAGPSHTYTAGGTTTFTYGTSTYTVQVNSQSVVSAGQTVTVQLVSGGDSTAGFYIRGTDVMNFAVSFTGLQSSTISAGAQGHSAGSTLTLTWQGGRTRTFTTADGAIKFDFGTASFTFEMGRGNKMTLSAGATFAVTLEGSFGNYGSADGGQGVMWQNGVAASGQFVPNSGGATNTVTKQYGIAADGAHSHSAGGVTAQTLHNVRYAGVGTSDQFNQFISELDTALTKLRTQAQTLGSNVALLNTRLDFTSNYVNTLTAGSGKLTLADINEEAANLLALQTRQQLGIQALSFAGQADQSVLKLF